MKKFRPLHDQLLVRRIESGEKTAGGIIIPDSAKEKAQQGEVIAIGNGKRLDNGTQEPVNLKEGDRVLFGKYAGNDIDLNGETLLLLKEDDILGIFE